MTREIADLRSETAELEARARRRRGLDGSGRTILPYQREDDDDDPDSSDLRGRLNPESSSSDFSRGTASETTAAAPRSGIPPRKGDELMSDEALILKTLWMATGKNGRSDDSPLRESANGEGEKVEKESRFRNGEFLGEPAQPSNSRNLDGDSLIGETKNPDQSAGFIFVEKVEKKRPVIRHVV